MVYSGIQKAKLNHRPAPRTEASHSTPNRSRPEPPSSASESRSSPAYAPTSLPRRGPTIPSAPPTASRPAPVNALTAAFNSKQSAESRRQDALAQERRREAESAPGYRNMAEGIKRYKYTGPDPRDEVLADMPTAGKENPTGEKVEQWRKEIRTTPAMANDNSARQSAKGGCAVEAQAEEMDFGDEEDDAKDDIFDSILSAKKTGKSKTSYLNDTIKPFVPITSSKSNSSSRQTQDQSSSRSKAKIQLAAQSAKIQPAAQPRITPNMPTVQKSNIAGSSARPPLIKPNNPTSRAPKSEAAKKKQLTRPKPVQDVDEYGDDGFDQLLASTTVFDDGTDMYADPAFDDAIEAALAGGAGW